MAGPNPHRLYSFAELRAIVGRSWVVCVPCRRYVTLPRGLADRDTPATTFSCSVCGEEAKHVTEDPGKDGKLQHDPRPRPRHHVDAVVRLKVFAEMRRHDEEKMLRDRPVRTEQPKPEPPRRYALKPFPVRTFGDLVTWGLTATVHCGSCRHHRPLVVEDRQLALPLLRPRLACSAIHPATAASAARPCTGRGQLWLSPADLDGVPAAPFVTVVCGHQDHTYLMASYLLLDRPPWARYLLRGEQFGCPQCGRRMGHTWHHAKA
jgi:hypothetical protein